MFVSLPLGKWRREGKRRREPRLVRLPLETQPAPAACRPAPGPRRAERAVLGRRSTSGSVSHCQESGDPSPRCTPRGVLVPLHCSQWVKDPLCIPWDLYPIAHPLGSLSHWTIPGIFVPLDNPWGSSPDGIRLEILLPIAHLLGCHCCSIQAISPVFSCLPLSWHPRPWWGGAGMVRVPVRLEQFHAEW